MLMMIRKGSNSFQQFRSYNLYTYEVMPLKITSTPVIQPLFQGGQNEKSQHNK